MRTAPEAVRMQTVCSFAVILSLIAAGCMMWDRLPEEMAVHFNFRMEPDDYAPRSFVVFGMPLMLAAMQLMCAAAAIGMKPGDNTLRAVTLWTVPAVSVVVFVLLFAFALGAKPDIGMWTQLMMGAVLIAVGNIVPKTGVYSWPVRRAYSLDADDRNKILRFRGYCLVLGGLVICVLALAGDTKMFFGIIALTGVLPWTYAMRVVGTARRA